MLEEYVVAENSSFKYYDISKQNNKVQEIHVIF